jgi:transcriptional regulator with XRE-family HTH domain
MTATTRSAITRKLDNITEKGGMRLVDVANVLGTRPETVSRWNQGKAFPHPSTEKQLLELEWVIEQLADFYEPQEARLWLFSRQKLLNGETPADLIAAGKSDEVLAVISQIRDSTYL